MGEPFTRMSASRQYFKIDRDKLRAAIRKTGKDNVFQMLIDAIDLLPPAKLHQIVEKHFDVKQLRPDDKKGTTLSLLKTVGTFDKASRAGDYYESFAVNSKNSQEESTGTTAWIAEYLRLLDLCVKKAGKADPTEVRQAFDILFGLLDRIDECQDDIIFFADEGGAWQVGVHWEKVLPPWFKVLSASADPDEYAQRITGLLKKHYHYGSAKMLAVAMELANPSQKQALSNRKAIS